MLHSSDRLAEYMFSLFCHMLIDDENHRMTQSVAPQSPRIIVSSLHNDMFTFCVRVCVCGPLAFTAPYTRNAKNSWFTLCPWKFGLTRL